MKSAPFRFAILWLTLLATSPMHYHTCLPSIAVFKDFFNLIARSGFKQIRRYKPKVLCYLWGATYPYFYLLA